MIRERIADNTYWFQSEIYAQVTAGAIIGPEWAILVDSMAVPDETLEIRAFIEDTLEVPVRYIINTIYHADHTFGNCFFPGTTIISHELCRQLICEKNSETLQNVTSQDPSFGKISIIPPDVTFESGSLTIRIGKRHVRIYSTPGASPDGISVFVKEDRVLFAGDAFLPLPNIVEGDGETLIKTITAFGEMSLENIVQGHGDVILRGEVEHAVENNIEYLRKIQKVVQIAVKHKDPKKILTEATVEACGKSRVLLGGMVEGLHNRNLFHLFKQAQENQ